MSYQWHLYVSIMLLVVNLITQLFVAIIEMTLVPKRAAYNNCHGYYYSRVTSTTIIIATIFVMIIIILFVPLLPLLRLFFLLLLLVLILLLLLSLVTGVRSSKGKLKESDFQGIIRQPDLCLFFRAFYCSLV